MYKPSYLQNKTMPTTDQAFVAKRNADNSPRNCRDLHAIIENMYEEDEDIFSFINIRKVGITSFSWVIVSKDKNLQDEAKIHRERLEESINRLFEYVWEISLNGIFALEMDWGQETIKLPTFTKKYDVSDLNWNFNPELIEYYNEQGIKQKVFTKTRDNYILVVNGSRPGGSLKRLINNRIIKIEMMREWANFNALVKGLITAKVSDTSSEQDIAAAQNALNSIMNRNYAIHGDETEFDFKELVSSVGATSFKDIIEKLDAKAEKVILGQSNATGLPENSGSRAALQVLSKISADIILNDMLLAEAMINNQLLKYYWLKNTGQSVCPFKFRFEWQEEVDPEKRAAVIDILLRNKIALRADEVYNYTGFTKPDNAEDIIMGSADVGY